MSKYSVEELIFALLRPTLCNYDIYAIIAKLRAGDKLCEAAKDADHLLMQNNYDSEEGTRKALRKAITDYEGKP